MSFSTYLKNYRVEKMLTQEELASQLNITVGAVRKIEAGEIKNPSSSLLITLSMLIGENTLKILTDINYGDQGYENNLINTYITNLSLLGWKIVFKMDNSASFIKSQYIITQKRNPMHYTILALVNAPKNYSDFEDDEREHYLSKQLKKLKNNISEITRYPIKETILVYDDSDKINNSTLIRADILCYIKKNPLNIKVKHVSFSLKTYTSAFELYTN